MKIAVMSDIGRTVNSELLPKEESVVDMIRIATYIHQIPAAIELVEEAHAKGYETTINIMAISKSFDQELDEVLEAVSNSSVDVIYIADSFGSFYPEQINRLTEKYLKVAEAKGKKIGILQQSIIDAYEANEEEVSREISTTGSTSQFHAAMSQSIKSNTGFGTISITDLGTGYHRFALTASATGSGGNSTTKLNILVFTHPLTVLSNRT